MGWWYRFGLWLRQKRRDQAYSFGKRAFDQGLPPMFMATGIWPKPDQQDLRNAFVRGWVHRAAINQDHGQWPTA